MQREFAIRRESVTSCKKLLTFCDDVDGFCALESLESEEGAVPVVKRNLARCVEKGSLESLEGFGVDER